nr:unnamed protein product [Spirometra erinaceieuropaei]
MSDHVHQLYIAKSLQELEAFCDVRFICIDDSKIPALISQCFSEADNLFGSDDERAYILYERGIKLCEKFSRRIPKQDFEKLAKKSSEAGKLVIALRHDLQKRYLIQKQCDLIDSLPICMEPLEVKHAAETKHYPGRWIPPGFLYAMLTSKDPILFIDVRPGEQFEHLHIKHSCQINLGHISPLSKGLTITRIERSLPDNERPSWDRRKSVSLIVLEDEDTGEQLIHHPEKAECFDLNGRHPLKIVYDALVTYNAEKDQLPPTVFLSGGIREFLKRYPTFVTASLIRKEPSGRSPQNKADSIAYPKLNDHINVGDNMLADEDLPPIPPEMSIHQNVRVVPYSELSKTLTEIASVENRRTDQSNHSTVVSTEAGAKKSPKSEELTCPPTVDRSNKPKSDFPSVPPPSYESLSDSLSNYAGPPPTVDRSTKPDAPNLDIGATEPNSSRTVSATHIHKVSGDDSTPRPSSTGSINAFPRPPSSHVKRVLRTGLVNIGNTCYMNSTIQALLHNSDLREFFITLDPRQRPCQKSGISRLFSHLLADLSSGTQNVIVPRRLKEGIGRLYPMFATSEQQDSHEFLILLLDSLHEDLNRAKSKNMPIAQSTSAADNNSVDSKMLAEESWERNRAVDDSEILDWFNGQLRSTVRCKACGRCSYTFDEFMYLSVSVQATDSLELKSCIRQFFKTEELSGSSRWMCPACKVPRDAVKTFDIWRLPKYLIIHLKRFQCFGACQKIESYVKFPLTELSLSHVTPQAPVSSCDYDLYAVVNHSGTMQSGHYIAFCLDETDKRWYKFDDQNVSTISADSIVTKGAYVLFYKRKEPRA